MGNVTDYLSSLTPKTSEVFENCLINHFNVSILKLEWVLFVCLASALHIKGAKGWCHSYFSGVVSFFTFQITILEIEGIQNNILSSINIKCIKTQDHTYRFSEIL